MWNPALVPKDLDSCVDPGQACLPIEYRKRLMELIVDEPTDEPSEERDNEDELEQLADQRRGAPPASPGAAWASTARFGQRFLTRWSSGRTRELPATPGRLGQLAVAGPTGQPPRGEQNEAVGY